LCVLKNACTDGKNRTITRDPREHLMEDMRAKLNTEEGTEQYQNMYRRTCIWSDEAG